MSMLDLIRAASNATRELWLVSTTDEWWVDIVTEPYRDFDRVFYELRFTDDEWCDSSEKFRSSDELLAHINLYNLGEYRDVTKIIGGEDE